MINNWFFSQNQSMGFLIITSELLFESEENSKNLQIDCKNYQTWMLYDLPEGWSASKNSGKGPQVITINATSNKSNSQITKTIRVVSGNKVAYCSIVQKAGYYTYAKPVITISYPKVTAAGGTYVPSASFTQTYGWNGETSGAGTVNSGGTWSFSGNLITNNKTGEISVTSLGITEKVESTITTITAKIDSNNISNTKDVNVIQEANVATYGIPNISSSGVNTIPASGGSVSVHNNVTTSQTITYTSKSTRQGTVNVTYSTPVSAPSLGTTIKETSTKVGVLTAYANGEGGKVNSKSLDVYQEKNIIIDNNYNPHITTYGTPTISIGSGLTAAGGSATVTSSVSNVVTYYETYSSTDIGPAKTRNEAGSITLTLTANGNSRFSLSGTTITHSSMTTNLTTDTVTITSTNKGDSSKKATASKSITNNRKATSTSGGVTTWEVVQIGSWSNKVIPASGGSATITPGDGSQKWNKTATTTTYTYDSGSTKNEVTEQASSGTATIKPNPASVTASAGSKGAVVSGETLVKSAYITWEGNAPGTTSQQLVEIRQAKNDYLDIKNFIIDKFAYITKIPSTGGSVSPDFLTYSYTAVFDSGNYDYSNIILDIIHISFNFMLDSYSIFDCDVNTGKVSANSNPSTSERSVKVTVTATTRKGDIMNYPLDSAMSTCYQEAGSGPICGECYLTLISSDATSETWRLDGDCCSALVDGCNYSATELLPGTTITVDTSCGCSGSCAGIVMQNPSLNKEAEEIEETK